jgi:hypothetical protein
LTKYLQFLNIGQHGVTGWWPVISAMLAIFLFYSGFGKETIPRPILQYKSTQVLFYFLYPTSPTEIDALNGPILEHGQRQFTTATLLRPIRIKCSYPVQLKAGCLLKHPSGVPDELQTTFSHLIHGTLTNLEPVLLNSPQSRHRSTAVQQHSNTAT